MSDSNSERHPTADHSEGVVSAVETFDPSVTSDQVPLSGPATPDPLICPLCGQANACLNLGAADVDRSCWCNDPAISFPESLLSRIPPEKRRKACVCRQCADAHQRQSKGEL